MPDKKQCAHPACSCEVPADGEYCSQYCADAADTLEIACNCGHTDCATAMSGRPLQAA
jgi:hypothetical protein